MSGQTRPYMKGQGAVQVESLQWRYWTKINTKGLKKSWVYDLKCKRCCMSMQEEGHSAD